jgi:hypothetical protein
MVRAVAEHLAREGYGNVRADVAGYSTPTELTWKGKQRGHIPDVTADGMIIEVETADSISDAHTEDQWKLFAAWAKVNSKTFVVVVPKGSEQAAERRLRELGITAQVWTA